MERLECALTLLSSSMTGISKYLSDYPPPSFYDKLLKLLVCLRFGEFVILICLARDSCDYKSTSLLNDGSEDSELLSARPEADLSR